MRSPFTTARRKWLQTVREFNEHPGKQSILADLSAKELVDSWLGREVLSGRLPTFSDVQVVLQSRLKPDDARASATLGADFLIIELGAPPDLDRAFKRARNEQVEAIIVLVSPFTYAQRARIASLAIENRLPAIAPFSDVRMNSPNWKANVCSWHKCEVTRLFQYVGYAPRTGRGSGALLIRKSANCGHSSSADVAWIHFIGPFAHAETLLRQAARDGTITAEAAWVVMGGTPSKPCAFC